MTYTLKLVVNYLYLTLACDNIGKSCIGYVHVEIGYLGMFSLRSCILVDCFSIRASAKGVGWGGVSIAASLTWASLPT